MSLSCLAAHAEPDTSSAADNKPTADPPLLLVDTTHEPHVRVNWTDADGKAHKGDLDAPYTVDADRRPITDNLECFVAVGGTRLTKGAGHPRGAVVRVGFYKRDYGKAMIANVTKDTIFEVTLSGVRFNQPVDVYPQSIIQHLKYDPSGMQQCGIPGDAKEQLNLASPVDTLNDRIVPGRNASLGALAGGADPATWGNALGAVAIKTEDDGSVTMTVRFRYPALRNIRDPWQSDLPGTFLEPIHFHLEFEAIPSGDQPLDPTRERETKPAPIN
ncbi:MAG: hypothetical protein H6810_07900 [Phycisphaeraceae bacterium]|nr:MAG: hypothetical protein H6810_07900 [Phycisphaeraceae bacterium]